MVTHLKICNIIQKKFVVFHAIYDVIPNTYSNKFFATSQIIHIGLTQRKNRNRLGRDRRNSKIRFWVFFLQQQGRATMHFSQQFQQVKPFSLE